ncbi:MAG TPA: hypothetical protein VMT20_06960 [Terriglobia bacterium]|nr:hypothetical protein [Terriglobia bacterium]
MAVSEYLVASPAGDGHQGVPTGPGTTEGLIQWNGAPAKCGISYEGANLGQILIVKAESTTEAVSGFRQLYPGDYNGKCYVVLKSSVEEK